VQSEQAPMTTLNRIYDFKLKKLALDMRWSVNADQKLQVWEKEKYENL